jgi:DNA-binding MarR family transcriptional regulator
MKITDDFLQLDKQLCFSLYAASRRLIQQYSPFFKNKDLTYTQYITLLVLWEHHRVNVTELGNYLMLDSGTLTPLLKKMEKKGWLTRERSKDDERNLIVEITPSGEAIKEDALKFLPSLLDATRLEGEKLIEIRELTRQLLASINEEG